MQGFVFNTRRAIFKDPKVRAALGYAFDFEWTNENLFYGQYQRTESYFSNSELASSGLPSEAELKLLEPYRDQLPEEVFTKEYQAPSTDGTDLRHNLRTALEHAAGGRLGGQNGRLVNKQTGQPLAFEILLVQPAFERIVGPFVQNLKRLGIDARIRTVDTAQYQNRLDNFDFDMIVGSWGESQSPGNEQRDYLGQPGGRHPRQPQPRGHPEPGRRRI